ncbi:RHS repeat-associated core domain-containing protein [Salmonella enterica subsp. enterica]|nr:RHS repeat-associated core domain-containing protein [Salmonella enterica subsp. enterica serovar Mikawasima]EDN7229194.1 RHS repeat-associated core domain-containing protein [Salmonella enterica subsp. enterica serovar Mikawasima]
MTIQLTGNDWHGSPLRTLSRGSNTLLSWSPYGATAPRSGSALPLPGFNGERQDPSSGVSHLGNGYRAYSPALRRFTCPDSESPFGVGGINAYAYCNADPVNQTDPSGHGPVTWLLRMAIRAGVRIGLSEALADGMATTLATAGKIETGLELASSAATGIASASLAGSNPQLAAKLGWASTGLGLAGGVDVVIELGSRIRREIKCLSARISRIKNTGLSGRGAPGAARQMASSGSVLETLMENNRRRVPIRSHTQRYQSPADDSLISSLELSTDESGSYSMRNLSTGDLSTPDGTYLFVNRVDEPGIVRMAELETIDGHTSMTQLADSVALGCYQPVDVYYAGEIVFDHGKLIRWTNGSGHYRPDEELSSCNPIPWVRRLLPASKFTPGTARYLDVFATSSDLREARQLLSDS